MTSTTSIAVFMVLLSVFYQARACDFNCPAGYTVIGSDDSSCAYACLFPANPYCLGSIGQPFQCGGSTFVKCPAIACTASYSTAFAGPTGCARAKSAIAAYSVSRSAFNSKSFSYINQTEICDGAANDSPVINAQNAVNAYAQAVAYAVLKYNAYVCSCCTGNSAAYAGIAGQVQAVAQAYAESLQDALASVSCSSSLLAGASAYVTAIAQDTQVAVTTASQAYASKSGKNCSSTGLQIQIQNAVAQAVACSFFQIYAAYKVASDTPDAYTCSATFALAGPGYNNDCPIKYCPV